MSQRLIYDYCILGDTIWLKMDKSSSSQNTSSTFRNVTNQIERISSIKGLSQILESTQIGFLTFPLLIATLTISITSIQLWLLKTRFRRELNSLFVVIKHLCVADLLASIAQLSNAILTLLEKTVLPNSEIIQETIDVAGLAFGKYAFTVSVVMLDT